MVDKVHKPGDTECSSFVSAASLVQFEMTRLKLIAAGGLWPLPLKILSASVT
jgi:hypothetical protein